MPEKNDLTEIKDAVLKEEPPVYDSDVPRPTKADILRAVEFSEAKKSLLLQLFGDTPKARILDFLIANKGQPFSKAKISEGAKVFKTAFFKQTQGKHYYNYFGDLVRLGVVKAVDCGERFAKYTLNIENKVVRALLNVDLALIEDAMEREKNEKGVNDE